MEINANLKIIVFDGVCVLCSRWVGFVLKRDHRNEYCFAAMQTETGRALLIQQGINPDDPVTFLLIDNGQPFTDTDAVLRIVAPFGIHWRIFAAIMRCIPRFIRNALYRWIARNRYRLFGRRDSCFVPMPEQRARFFD
jgi:predicted DCC family thiol-disulfide oxidoreductase YuxK